VPDRGEDLRREVAQEVLDAARAVTRTAHRSWARRSKTGRTSTRPRAASGTRAAIA
jgi:hypothetical protein